MNTVLNIISCFKGSWRLTAIDKFFFLIIIVLLCSLLVLICAERVLMCKATASDTLHFR